MDCYSRRIVGWALADHLRAELVVDALEMAVARRRPDAGLVHHSDRGSQFTSLIFTRRCRSVGIDVSMGSRGDCFDNAVLESFHATLKKDLIHRPLLANQGRSQDRGLRLHRELLQPPAPPLDARDALARGVRERNSQDRRCQSRRFAARIPQQDGVQLNINGPSRLTTPCPPNRGNSTPDDYQSAIFAYNHAGWYVAEVLAKAEEYRGAMQRATRVGGAGAQAILAAANKLDAMDIGYVYGGGHVQPAIPNPGLDCSSSVSWVHQHAGINMPTMTSGLLMNWGDPGPGKTITIYANPDHTFMKIGSRYFGTSGFGHPGAGTGPHWFTRQPSPSYLATFVRRHPPGL